MDDKAIVAQINVLFRRSGLKQYDAADALGISRNAFCNILYGKTKNIYKYLPALADLFGVSEESLTYPDSSLMSNTALLDTTENYQEQLNQLRSEYEDRIAAYQRTISEKDELIATLKKLCSMLEHQLGQN